MLGKRREQFQLRSSSYLCVFVTSLDSSRHHQPKRGPMAKPLLARTEGETDKIATRIGGSGPRGIKLDMQVAEFESQAGPPSSVIYIVMQVTSTCGYPST